MVQVRSTQFLADNVREAFLSGFALATLPADMQVKLVVFEYVRTIFLASPSTEVGDEILHCVFSNDDGQGERLFLPVVRAYDQKSAPYEESWYSFLVGWALQHDHAGGVPPDVDMDRVTIYLHYKELILHAILEQDPKASITYPSTHHECPSFLADAARDRWT